MNSNPANPLYIVDVTPKNVTQETLFCSKDIKSQGFKCKEDWFLKQYEKVV